MKKWTFALTSWAWSLADWRMSTNDVDGGVCNRLSSRFPTTQGLSSRNNHHGSDSRNSSIPLTCRVETVPLGNSDGLISCQTFRYSYKLGYAWSPYQCGLIESRWRDEPPKFVAMPGSDSSLYRPRYRIVITTSLVQGLPVKRESVPVLGRHDPIFWTYR